MCDEPNSKLITGNCILIGRRGRTLTGLRSLCLAFLTHFQSTCDTATAKFDTKHSQVSQSKSRAENGEILPHSHIYLPRELAPNTQPSHVYIFRQKKINVGASSPLLVGISHFTRKLVYIMNELTRFTGNFRVSKSSYVFAIQSARVCIFQSIQLTLRD